MSTSIAERTRRLGESLAGAGRSPLVVALMRGMADDVDVGGIVSELFEGIPTPPGSVPSLRLVAALHRLVLDGDAPALASYYPSAGGDRPPADIWPLAETVLRAHAARVRDLLHRTVQTNETGRSTVLFGGLLWLAERHGLPVRLLEIGASAGLNLLVDRFAYRVGGLVLGDPASPVAFDQPWVGRPVADPAAVRLRIAERAGCDPAPPDLRTEEGRRTVLSYVWPDERERWRRALAALAVAGSDPPHVDAAPARTWLPGRLAASAAGTLTVVWHSVMWQYLAPGERDALDAALAEAGTRATADRPLARLSMEPDGDPAGFAVTVTTWPDGETRALARSGDHGPPVRWA